ncbi:TraB/GumN family protein [Kiloniella sp. b19]|uniref:TraB/GumN family protein n=1 Tax=Kiloniella sp. GXU_MW_B19 TaxID=3141326 RepID=UPI0031DD70C3
MIAHANHMLKDLLGRGVVILTLLIPLLLGTVTAGASGTLDPDAFNLNGQGLLWKIEKDGSPGPSYLLGTMHSTEDQVVAVAQAVRPLVARVKTLIVEVEDDPSLKAQVFQSMVLSDGRTLQQILPPDLFQSVGALSRSYGLSPEQLNGLKPWAMLALFAAPPSEAARVSVGRLNLDQRLQIEARQSGVGINSLETPREQLSVFEDLSDEDVIALLGELPSNPDDYEIRFAIQVRNYLLGDLAGMYRAMLADMENIPPSTFEPFMDSLIHERNTRMAQRAMRFLESQEVLIAVGALHLPGETGLVEQFRALGYTVTPLQ